MIARIPQGTKLFIDLHDLVVSGFNNIKYADNTTSYRIVCSKTDY